MSLRDLVTGSDMCTPSGDGAGPSNAMGSLVHSLLGGAAKTQEQLRELPMVQPRGPGMMMPGMAHPSGLLTPEAAAAMGMPMEGMHVPGVGMSAGGHALLSSIAPPHALEAGAHPGEWDSIFGGQPAGVTALAPPHALQQQQPQPGGASSALLSQQFHSFLGAARHAAHFAPGPMPPALAGAFSVEEKCRIRDRATILGRHVFADQGEAFADQQVGHLLASLHINPSELPAELPHAHDQGWHDIWKGAAVAGPAFPPGVAAELAAGAHAAQHHHHPWDNIWQPQGPVAAPTVGWANEFAEQQQQQPVEPAKAVEAPQSAWAEEFAEAHPGEAWANEFTETTDTAERSRNADAAEAMQSTQALVDVLSRNGNPKMLNSKFFQFVSKMSKGELMFEDNKVVEVPAAANSWAQEFGEQQAAPAPQGLVGDWADDFARGVADMSLNGSAGPAWADNSAWAEEFNREEDEEMFREWERVYGQGRVESSYAAAVPGPNADKRSYMFARDNPFLGDPQALEKGKDLFRRGVLSEAALALEAEVQAHPNSAEAWRLLGTVHAENDDDQQAIAAMLRALAADPRDLHVLLALGVSFTNELDQGEAIQHLATWLSVHPDYANIAESMPPGDSSQALSRVVRMFKAAAQQAPQDADLHMAVGVLNHLARNYGAAIGAFERALQLRPSDYSLWNKLGATLANASRSAEAIHAYQKALDLKPNYMRAWTNMGISFANVGDYDKSSRFYIRALELNPTAEHVWGYLRTSLACAGRLELTRHVDAQELGALSAALPLSEA